MCHWHLSLIFQSAFTGEPSQSSRSSHRRCFVKKGVPKSITKFTGKHLCQCLFFNKVAGLIPATLLKKRLWYRCFPVNFVKFLKTRFLQNISGRLLLNRGIIPSAQEHTKCILFRGKTKLKKLTIK